MYTLLPDLGALWRAAAEHRVTHFGGSPKLFGACMSAGIAPINGLAAAPSSSTSSSSSSSSSSSNGASSSKLLQLDALRCVLSTGAPLLPEHFSWIYNSCKVSCTSYTEATLTRSSIHHKLALCTGVSVKLSYVKADRAAHSNVSIH
jgi:acyl-coenzyme A synthetase/AMP-(fatty) acid ligase